MSPALLYALLGLNSTLTNSSEIPPYVWKLLGNHVVITPQTLSGKTNIQIPYVLLNSSDVVKEEITGAIVAGDGMHIVDQIIWITAQPGWFPRATVVIQSAGPDLSIFRKLWIKRIANVITVTTTGNYAYNPFIDLIIPVEEHVSKNLSNRWKNMMGYTISVSMYEQQLSFRKECGISLGAGIDGSALYELMQYWNMTVNLIISKYIDDKYTSPETKVSLGNADLFFNAYAIFRITDKMEYSAVVNGETFCVVFRIPDKLRGSDMLIRIKDWRVYVGLLALAIIANKTMQTAVKNRGCEKSLLMVLKSLLNVPIQRPPQSVRDRLILGFTMIFGMTIITSYQASMFHILTASLHSNEMKTLKEVYDNNIHLRSSSVLLRDLNSYSDVREIRKLRNSKIAGHINDGMLDHAGLVLSEKELRLLKETNLLRREVYALAERVGSYTTAYPVKRGSPFLPSLTDFAIRAFEGGLFEKWYRLTVERIGRYSAIRGPKTTRAFGLYDTEIAFFVLFAGYGSAIILFLLELLAKKLNMDRMFSIWEFLVKLFTRLCS